MPAVDDYDKNDQDTGGSDDGYTPAQSAGSATGAPKTAPQQQSEPQAYVPWSSFASANQDVSEREAGKLKGQVQGDVSKAQGDLSSAQSDFNQGIDNAESGLNASFNASAPGAPPSEKLSNGAAPAQVGRSTDGQSATSNPWESFLGGGGSTPPVTAASTQPQAAPTSGVQRSAVGDLEHPGASKDLEAATGAQAWSQLLGDTLKGSKEAHLMGSQSGVQALLQQGQTSPMGNSAFDAALINGAGQHDFQQMDQQYGGNQLEKGVVNAENASQGRWSQLQGDIAAHQAQVAAQQPQAAAAPNAAAPADAAAPPAADPLAQWDGFDPATQGYGQSMLDKSGGHIVYDFDQHDYQNGPYSSGGPFDNSTAITVPMKMGADGKGTADWSTWFGGGDAGNKSPSDLGLTPQEVWSLSLMKPDQRAAWLKKHLPGGK